MIEIERRKIIIYGENTGFSEAQIQQIGAIVASALSKHLDSFNADVVGMPKGDNDMPKKIKAQRFVHNGETYWLSGNSQQELFEEAGRICTGERRKKDNVLTVEQFVEKVYKPNYLSTLAPTTAGAYIQFLNGSILPFMGSMRLDKVTVNTVLEFRKWMAEGEKHGKKKNLNAQTIERVTGLLSRLFRIAMEMKLVDDTPVKKTLLPKIGEAAGHHTAMPDDLINRIKRQLPYLGKKNSKLFVGLLAYTGMRPEEALGLKWEDIRFDSGYCTISRAVVYANGENQPLIKKPKTESSSRTVIMVRPLLELLEPYRKESGFVLTPDNGVSPLTSTVKRRVWMYAKRELQIEGFTPYDFRTTYGTQLCERGITSKQCADVLGHADTRMVETIYARRRHDGVMRQKQAIESMNEIYTGYAT